MDQATQQNAALVEEMAAAASSLKSQAQDLVQVVAVFKLAQGQQVLQPMARPTPTLAPRAIAPVRAATSARAVVTKPAAKPLAVPKLNRAPAPASGDENWESF
jgi:methyl-accepting chemotaxis protein